MSSQCYKQDRQKQAGCLIYTATDKFLIKN